MFAPKRPDSWSNMLTREQPELEDCANAYLMLAKNTSITGQSIQIGMCSDLRSE